MGKFTIVVLALYILYYGGNIIYDLFLKKQNAVKPDDEEVFAIADIASKERPEIATVGIEDAENLNTPASFTPNIIAEEPQAPNIDPDIEELRRRFEFEVALEDIENGNNNPGHNDADEPTSDIPSVEPAPTVTKKTSDELQKENTEKFREMVNLAETSFLVVNHNGVRNYKSALF